MDMDKDEEQISNWLTKNNLRVEKFTKKEKRESKTPDFSVFSRCELAFFCEVKTILKDGCLDGHRNDPIFNRLTDDIHTAVKQFDAVNPSREYINVLAFVNHDESCGFNDLLAVITGNFFAEDGSQHPIYRSFSDGRIKEEKNRVHLYYWKDDYKPERFLFANMSDRKILERLCGYFDKNPDEIATI